MITIPQLCEKIYMDFMAQGEVVIRCNIEGEHIKFLTTVGGRPSNNLVSLRAIIYLLMGLNADCCKCGDETSSDRLHEAMQPLAMILLEHDKEYANRN